MHLWKSIAAIVAVLFLTVQVADAKTVRYSKTARANASTKIDHYSGWNDDCSFLTIDIDVVEKPRNGAVRPKLANGRIPRPQVGSRQGAACAGRPMKIIEVYYTPTRGFRGNDQFKVRMRTPGQRVVFFVYRVKVN